MQTVIINVGGQLFQTTESTLQQSEYFAGIITQPNFEQPIFVDRSPHYLNMSWLICRIRSTIKVPYEIFRGT